MSTSSRSSTIEEVAAAAGVSVATVSRALRGLPNVAPSTRKRVQEVAEQLSYRANPSASRLAAGRTATIALVVPVVDSWYFAQVIAGAEAVLSDGGYDLLVFAIGTEAKRHRVLSGPVVKRADGLILVDLRIDETEVRRLKGSGVVVVTIGSERDGLSAVVVDDFHIGKLATEYLLELGHRRIGLISGVQPDPLEFPIPPLRRDGYRYALNSHGIKPRTLYDVPGDFSVLGGAEAMARLLRLPEPPTAVFAMSDDMAFGAMHEVREQGMDVPGDISIVGVDNHVLSNIVGLTTIDQEAEGHGAAAARMLLDQLGEPPKNRPSYLAKTTLIERSSATPWMPR